MTRIRGYRKTLPDATGPPWNGASGRKKVRTLWSTRSFAGPNFSTLRDLNFVEESLADLVHGDDPVRIDDDPRSAGEEEGRVPGERGVPHRVGAHLGLQPRRTKTVTVTLVETGKSRAHLHAGNDAAGIGMTFAKAVTAIAMAKPPAKYFSVEPAGRHASPSANGIPYFSVTTK